MLTPVEGEESFIVCSASARGQGGSNTLDNYHTVKAARDEISELAL